MSKANFQKIKLVKILEILKAESDESKPLSTNDIIKKLAEHGIKCERKSLYEDIKVLQEHGYEIECTREKSNKYCVINRDFDPSELKILIDAVNSASFITEKKTKQFVSKIASLGGSKRAEILQSNINIFEGIKHTNEHIYYNVFALDEAIIKKKQVSFLYFDFNYDGKRMYRKDGLRYVVNPIALVFSENNYYLYCYDDKHMNIVDYRVDKMDKVEVEPNAITPSEIISNFDISKYQKQSFSMYLGKKQEVRINFHKSILNVIFDKFGEKTEITVLDENVYSIKVDVQISPTFFGWCCTFENKLKIVSPKNVVQQMRQHIEKIYGLYNKE